MKLKHLESALSSATREFPSPKVTLEQYPTSAHLTASVIFTALQNGDLGPGRTALDLGCGTGMLALGCALIECDHVVAIDCDPDAMQVAIQNAQELEVDGSIDFLLGQVTKPSWTPTTAAAAPPRNGQRRKGRRHAPKQTAAASRGRFPSKSAGVPVPPPNTNQPDDGILLRSKCVDTVLTNPPFGTKHTNAGMDVQFLRTATRLAQRAVYSFHKTSTRDYLIKTVQQEWGLPIRVIAELKFDIPNMYKFHEQKSVDVQVDLLRISCCENEEDDKQTEEVVGESSNGEEQYYD